MPGTVLDEDPAELVQILPQPAGLEAHLVPSDWLPPLSSQ